MPLALESSAAPECPPRPRIAVIDIGSNSMRLVVYDGLSRVPMPLFNEKIMCGLGRAVEKTGRLDPDGVALALENLGRFRRLADSMEVGRMDVLATAAVRDAHDGAEFVREVERRTGFEVRVISGEEEARLSALGVLAGTPDADGIMGDLGGGSLELVGLDRGSIGAHSVSLPLGSLRLAQAVGGKPVAAYRSIDEQFEAQPWLSGYKGRNFYPVGGSWRALAKLHMEQTGHPLHIIHHYEAETAALRGFLALIAKMSRSSLEKLSGVSRRRLETLPYAALVLERALRAIEPSRVVFSAHGLREGLLFDWLTPEERQQDPWISACMDVARRLGRFGKAEALSDWTSALFVGENAAGARLRRAACLLSDLGWAEHPDYRAEHAFLRVLRMPFPGIEHSERAFLALAIYARYAGKLDDGNTRTARKLVTDTQAEKALILGVALRLAQTLTGGAMDLLRQTSLTLGDRELTLVVPQDAAVLVGEIVERRLDALARTLNRSGAISYQPRPQAA